MENEIKVRVVENLSNDAYHNGDEWRDYWSSSNLKVLKDQSPRIAKYKKKNAKNEPTPAMVFGTQVHDFLASKHRNGQKFDYQIFNMPLKNDGSEYASPRASKAYKALVAKIENPMDSEQFEIIKDIWDMILDSAYRYKFESYLLVSGAVELSVFVHFNGFKYKSRYDLTANEIYDYKTINQANFTERGRVAQMNSFGYAISAAMYQWIEFLRTGMWKKFILIWIMKEAPYDVLFVDISAHCYLPIEDGKDMVKGPDAILFEKIKDQYEACVTADCYPGESARYDGDIQESSPSHWDTGEYLEYEIAENQF